MKIIFFINFLKPYQFMNIERGRELYPIGIVGENMTWSGHKRK